MVDNGKTYLTMFFCHNSTENTHLLNEEIIVLEIKITNIRKWTQTGAWGQSVFS
jgi:hypothetical protein